VVLGVLTLAPIAAYFVYLWRRFADNFVDQQVVWSQYQRYFASNFAGFDSTPAYYLHTILWAAAPWALVGYGALLLAVIHQRLRWHARDPRRTFLYAWLFTFFVVFSFSRSRLPQYIFPVLPALALVIADEWPALALTYKQVLAWLTLFAASAFAILIFTIAFPLTAGLLLLAVPAALALWLWQRRGDERVVLATTGLAMSFALTLFSGYIAHALNAYKPMPKVAAVLKRWGDPEVWRFHVAQGGIDFMSQGEMHEASAFTELAPVLQGGAAVVVPTGDVDKLEAQLPSVDAVSDRR
jgi:4-amino-4-deoxy-L-arabinose transferase-like glycosyltransferase